MGMINLKIGVSGSDHAMNRSFEKTMVVVCVCVWGGG